MDTYLRATVVHKLKKTLSGNYEERKCSKDCITEFPTYTEVNVWEW